MSFTLSTPDDIDELVEQVRARYRAERDKRLRSDSNQQYRAIEGDLGWFDDDPHVTEPRQRAPLTDQVEVTIIGAGISGLLAGAKLRTAGVETVRLIDKAGDVGGAWYWNRYPGAQCDIEAYIYLPLLEEIGVFPQNKYATQPEIYSHCQAIAKQFGLYEDALFQTAVNDVVWDESARMWAISTSQSDHFHSRYVVVANGPLSRPKLPGVPGLGEFRGHQFHTSRWDFDYTGGDQSGGLDKLNDRVVGVIGTGATAVQAIPHLGRHAKHLYVFQRTPSAIWPRTDRPTDPEWIDSLEAGWQEARMMNFDHIAAGLDGVTDLVSDGWTELYRALRDYDGASGRGDESQFDFRKSKHAEYADYLEMERVRARVDQTVRDPKVAELLKPYFRAQCKRACFHDEYLETFNRTNVTLVDTGGNGVERLDKTGAVVGGKHFDLDCLVYATGFETSTSPTHRLAFDPVGRDGTRLSAHWADGSRTLFGMHTHGFPNLFFLGYLQSGAAANYTHSVYKQVDHLLYLIQAAAARGAVVLDVTREAEQEWIGTMIQNGQESLEFWAECTPSRFNDDGNLAAAHGKLREVYGGGALEFWSILQRWRDRDQLEGIALEP